MWFTSSQWGWSSSGSRMLQCGVQQCQNILKVWALANYFSRTGYSQLTPSVSAASASLTHQNLPKAKLISFFLLFFFHFGHQNQRSKHDFSSQQAAYDGCVAAPCFGRWLSSKVAFLHKAKDQLCRASPGHPGQLQQSQEGFPLITHPRSLAAKLFV